MGEINSGRLTTWVRAGAGAHQGLRYLALAIAWLFLWRVSALMQYAPHASLWFPPAGLTFAALLIMGWRAVPVLMSCAVLVTFWIDQMYQSHTPWRALLVSGLLFGAGHCLSYGLGAALLKRVIRRSQAQSAPTIVILFLLTSSLAALSAALLGVRALEVTGMLSSATEGGLWLPWWIGDMAGAQVLTPLFVGLISWRYPQIEPWLGGLNFHPQPRGRGAFAIKLAISVSLVTTELLLAARFSYPQLGFGMFFLVIPQMWIVYTESPFRSALSIALFSTTTAVLVAMLGLVHQAQIYQFAICVIAANAYFGFAVPALIARNMQLSELVLSDSLTKVATKAHFFERAERELADARREGQPVSLIVLDIDRFKGINDNFGHTTGDLALIKLTRVIRKQLRERDVLGRFGGDEFMVLLPNVALDDALATAERLRDLLQHTEIPGTQQHLSASFGVVSVNDEETITQAFNHADSNLLQAKRNGRNTVGSDVRV